MKKKWKVMGRRGAGCLAHSSYKELPVKNLKFRFRVCDSDVGRYRIHLLPQAHWICSHIWGNSLWGKETNLEGATHTHWANQGRKPALWPVRETEIQSGYNPHPWYTNPQSRVRSKPQLLPEEQRTWAPISTSNFKVAPERPRPKTSTFDRQGEPNRTWLMKVKQYPEWDCGRGRGIR